MVNKRYKKEIEDFIYKGEKTPFTLGTLVVVIFCVFLLILATFSEFNLVRFRPLFEDSFKILMVNFPYVAQIPTTILISAILGIRFSLLTLILYILLGLFLVPVFGYGGGIQYAKLYVFGYILGFIPATFAVNYFLKKYTGFLSILYAGLAGIFSVYLTGILYALILLLFRQINFQFFVDAVLYICFTRTFYDFLLSVFAILISCPIKQILWLAMNNSVSKRQK